MSNVNALNAPAELVEAYTEIVKNEPDYTAAGAHLVNFLLDAQKIAQTVQEAVDAAKQRASQPVQ